MNVKKKSREVVYWNGIGVGHLMDAVFGAGVYKVAMDLTREWKCTLGWASKATKINIWTYFWWT